MPHTYGPVTRINFHMTKSESVTWQKKVSLCRKKTRFELLLFVTFGA
jgi:hypothetical protein